MSRPGRPMEFSTEHLRVGVADNPRRFTVKLSHPERGDGWHGRLHSLSESMLFIAGEAPGEVGEGFSFAIEVVGLDQPIKGEGRIGWIRKQEQGRFLPRGFTLEILSLTPGQAASFHRVLEEALTTQTIADLMNADVFMLPPETTLADAARQMAERDVGAVLVVEADRRLAGIFTERDFLYVASHLDPRQEKLARHMTRNVITLSPKQALDEALVLAARVRFRHLPVVESGKVVGILSTRDLLQHWLHFLNIRVRRVRRELETAVGLIVHDLRNPLTTIRIMNRLLLGGQKERELYDESGGAKMVDERIEHMLSLIDELLALTDLEVNPVAIAPQTTDVAALTTRTVKRFRAEAVRKEIDLVVEAEESCTWTLDPRRFEQILDNFLSNALKYTPPKGKVEVRLATRPEGLLLEVADTGPGIPEEERPRLFQPFARLSPKPTGGEASSGLGLAVVRAIAEAHGAQAGYAPRADGGSIFSILFPKA